MSILSRCRVVLVRTHYPGNLGAVARAMANFGLSDLVLVDPRTSAADPEARRLATHGLPLLDAARVAADLGDAVADCGCVLGTSALAAGPFREAVAGPPDALLPRLLTAAAVGPVALVFGPEPHGLTNDEVTRCHGLIRIPVDPRFPALNLSQAVTVCLYELRKLAGERLEPAAPADEVAAHAELERMFGHLREALEAVHYLYGSKADALMHAVRHLIGRAAPTRREVRMLHGLARQLLYLARTSATGPPDDGADDPVTGRPG